MYTIIEFCLFDLDASGLVGLHEVMEMFYRRYGRIADLERREMTGIITFKQFVKRDTAFYSLSRQIEDSHKAIDANKRKKLLADLQEQGATKEDGPKNALARNSSWHGGQSSGRQVAPNAMTPRGATAQAATRTGLRRIKAPTATGQIRSSTGRATRAEEAQKKEEKAAKEAKKMAEQAKLDAAQQGDWRNIPKDELSRRARQEAERALQAEADLAKERAKKSSDMVPKITTADKEANPPPGARGADGKLLVPTYPEIRALQERTGTSDPDLLDLKAAMDWKDGRQTQERKILSGEAFRPPSRIMYGHHGLRQPV